MKKMILLLGAVIACATPSVGKPKKPVVPYIGCLYPVAVQRGTSAQITISGQLLHAKNAIIYTTAPGVTVTQVQVVPSFRPLPKPQRRWVASWMKGIHAGRPLPRPALPTDQTDWDFSEKTPWLKLNTYDSLALSYITHLLYNRPNPLQSTPSLSQKIIVDLTVSADTPVGTYDLRYVSHAISNPRPLIITDCPEVREPLYIHPDMGESEPRPHLSTFPCGVNGVIMPKEVDAFEMDLEGGQTYTFTLLGRALLPFIGDGVPGHFQPQIAILNDAGKEVAFADDCGRNPDPTLTFTPKTTDTYTLKVQDALFRGRSDFVYHVAITLGGATRQPYLTAQDGRLYTFSTQGQVYKQTLSPKKGVTYVITAKTDPESLVDPVLTLSDSAGRTLQRIDDTPVPHLIGTYHHHSTATMLYVAKDDKPVTITLTNRTNLFGAEMQVALSVKEAQPDFDIYIDTSALNLFSGRSIEKCASILVIPKNGFSAPITLSSPDLSFGDTVTIPAGVTTFPITLEATHAQAMPLPITITATSGDLTKTVIPTQSYTQAFAYAHYVPESQLLLKARTVWKPKANAKTKAKGDRGAERKEKKRLRNK